MKILFAALGILLSSISPFYLYSQCAGGAAAFTLTYDTTVFGNGNASRSFSFPKFDPALGTLLSADLQSVVGLEYSYNLENQTSQDKIFKTKIVRTDDIISTALDPSSISAVNQTPFVPYLIPAYQQLNYGPAHMNYSIFNSVNDGRLVNFMGAGTVNFDYETGTSASVQGPLPWQLNFTAVNDTTHFSITYRYCSANLLSAGLLFFSATAAKGKVLLNWRQASTEANRVYSVQISTDAQKFTTLAVIPENNSGVYAYTHLHNSSKKLYFRIQEKIGSGEVKYSYIRLVEPEQQANTGGIRIFPTMYTGGNLQVEFPEKGDWHINLYSAEGQKMFENRQTGVYPAKILLPGNINNGIYLAEIVNAQTQQRQLKRIVIQR